LGRGPPLGTPEILHVINLFITYFFLSVKLYPDSGIFESWDILVRLHFYRTMEDFFAKCFQVEEQETEDDILPITKVIKGVKKFD
jgi:hypothetical protein